MRLRGLSPLVAGTLCASACSPGTESIDERLPRARSLQQAAIVGETAQIAGSDGTAFAQVLAVDGDDLIVGASSDATQASNAGAAYVLVKTGTTWTEQQKLFAGDGAAGHQLGSSVDIDGNTAIAGAPAFGGGAAYVFVRSGTTWTEEQKLLPSDGAPDDEFGRAVAVEGDTAFVGAPFNDSAGTDSGAAYVFVRSGTTWTEQQKLLPNSDAGQFGTALAVDAGTLIVGAPRDYAKGTAAGAVYAFVSAGGWVQQAKVPNTITGIGAANGNRFGAPVAISGDTAAVGAVGTDTSRGAAWVLVRSGTNWSAQESFHGSELTDLVGAAVAIVGDDLLVGIPNDDYRGGNAGSVLYHHRTGSTWTEVARFLASDGESFDRLGSSAVLAGKSAIVGSPGHDTVTGGGALYVFPLDFGIACATGAECSSGFCVDGVCCDTPCDESCATCLAAEGASVDGVCAAADTGNPGSPSCAPFVCNGFAVDCPTSCSTSTHCQTTHHCSNGNCRVDLPLSRVCTEDAQCETDHCVDGFCCESACDGECVACARGLTGKTNGTCSPIAAGTDPARECDDDGSPACTHNGLCDGAGACASYPVSTGCAAEPCTSGSDCASGFCVDGVCCDTECTGDCQACSAAAKGVGVDGVCGPVAAGTDPDDDCVSSSTPCAADGRCDGQGACRLHAPSTAVCGTATCNGNDVAGDLCDGMGTCVASSTAPCAPYVCDSGACTSSCTASSECASGAFCSTAGVCLEQLAAGEACTAAEQCQSGYCVDGICCESACDAQCEVCGAGGTCSAATGAPKGARSACDAAGSECGGACDGVLRTACSFAAAGTACGTPACSDGEARASRCDGSGACVADSPVACTPYACGAAACLDSCSDDSECDAGFRCNADGACASASVGCTTDAECSPYRCEGGTCGVACSDTSDCAGGFSCIAGACAATTGDAGTGDAGSDAGPPPSSGSKDDGGCGCRTVGERSFNAGRATVLAPMALVSVLTLRRRRRPVARKSWRK